MNTFDIFGDVVRLVTFQRRRPAPGQCGDEGWRSTFDRKETEESPFRSRKPIKRG